MALSRTLMSRLFEEMQQSLIEAQAYTAELSRKKKEKKLKTTNQ